MRNKKGKKWFLNKDQESGSQGETHREIEKEKRGKQKIEEMNREKQERKNITTGGKRTPRELRSFKVMHNNEVLN